MEQAEVRTKAEVKTETNDRIRSFSQPSFLVFPVFDVASSFDFPLIFISGMVNKLLIE